MAGGGVTSEVKVTDKSMEGQELELRSLREVVEPSGLRMERQGQ